jgi:hypothetical protein
MNRGCGANTDDLQLNLPPFKHFGIHGQGHCMEIYSQAYSPQFPLNDICITFFKVIPLTVILVRMCSQLTGWCGSRDSFPWPVSWSGMRPFGMPL